MVKRGLAPKQVLVGHGGCYADRTRRESRNVAALSGPRIGDSARSNASQDLAAEGRAVNPPVGLLVNPVCGPTTLGANISTFS
jgi:hypothetical protein